MLSTEKNTSEIYDEHYYRVACGPVPYERSEHWLNFFAVIADEIVRSLHSRRVLDAGCAKGFLVEALWDRGVYCEGIDISEHAISQVRRDIREYCSVGSIANSALGKFDLVTCIEVLEHLPVEMARAAIGNLCAAADVVLFSSTPSDFEEPTHLNVRPPIYWLQLFSEFGFFPDARFEAGFIAPHAMLLRKGAIPEDDFLRLFSEYIRYKTALQAATRRAEQLAPKTEEISALRQRVSELQQRLSSEVQQRVSEINQLHAALAAEKAALAAQTASYETLQNELDRSRDWAVWLQRELTEDDKARQETAVRLRAQDTEIQSLQQKLLSDAQAFEAKLASSNSEREHLLAETGRLEMERAGVQATLNAVLSSRAWRLAERCRIPVQKLRRDWPRLYRIARSAFSNRPVFSIIVPVYRVEHTTLQQCVQSVLDQTYANWELCIAHAPGGEPRNLEYLRELALGESKVRLLELNENGGISRNSNAALDLATGEFPRLPGP